MSNRQTDKRLRIFCAVELPAEVRARVVARLTLLRQAQAAHVKIGWERAEKLHLTLKFLGDIESTRLAALRRALEFAVAGTGRFTVSLAEAGAFPARGNPRVLWLGVPDRTGRLSHLHQRLDIECARAGFPRDARPFHPHVTLARIRVPNDAARSLAQFHAGAAFEPVSFAVNEVVLLRSELGAGGSRYTPLSRHELKTEAGG